LGTHHRDYNCFGIANITVEVVGHANLVTIRRKTERQDINNYIPKGEGNMYLQEKAVEGSETKTAPMIANMP